MAHRLSTIKRADRIYVLDQGSVLEQGTHEQLIDQRGRYASLWETQVGTAANEPRRQHDDTFPGRSYGNTGAAIAQGERYE